MTLQQIEYIIALDNHRNFVKAATSCYVTQPTLTMQVQKLEEEIGVKLFDRSKKPLQPTTVGVKFVAEGRLILRNVAQLKSIVSEETESLAGNYKIGIIPTIAPYLLPKFLPSFLETTPEAHLEIQEQQTEYILTNIKNGNLDMAILSTPIQDSAIREIPVYHEPFLLYLNPENELIKKEKVASYQLNVDNLLFLEEGHCFRHQALSLCKKLPPKSEHKFDYKSGSIESLIALTNQNMGYTLVPELAIQSNAKNKQVKRFESPQPVREISIIVHQSFSKEALIERLKNVILKNLPKHFKTSKNYKRLKWQ